MTKLDWTRAKKFRCLETLGVEVFDSDKNPEEYVGLDREVPVAMSEKNKYDCLIGLERHVTSKKFRAKSSAQQKQIIDALRELHLKLDGVIGYSGSLAERLAMRILNSYRHWYLKQN